MGVSVGGGTGVSVGGIVVLVGMGTGVLVGKTGVLVGNGDGVAVGTSVDVATVGTGVLEGRASAANVGGDVTVGNGVLLGGGGSVGSGVADDAAAEDSAGDMGDAASVTTATGAPPAARSTVGARAILVGSCSCSWQATSEMSQLNKSSFIIGRCRFIASSLFHYPEIDGPRDFSWILGAPPGTGKHPFRVAGGDRYPGPKNTAVSDVYVTVGRPYRLTSLATSSAGRPRRVLPSRPTTVWAMSMLL